MKTNCAWVFAFLLGGCAAHVPARPAPPKQVVASTPLSSEQVRSWEKTIVSANERFVSQPMTITFHPTASRGVVPNLPGVGPGAELDLTTVFCTDDRRSVPAKVTCTGELPAKSPAVQDARTGFDNFVESLGRCDVKVRAHPADAEQLQSVAAELSWARSGSLRMPAPNKAAFVVVTHLTRERIYENDCTHVEHVPCDPVHSWATDRFDTIHDVSFELLSADGGAPLELAFQAQTFYPRVPMFGHREDGWFVPAPVFAQVFATNDPASALESLLSATSEDPDEALTLALDRALIALRANDPRMPELAAAFVKSAESRPLRRVHFELQPTMRELLPLLRQLATGNFAGADPCAADLR